MPEFLELLPPPEALARLLQKIAVRMAVEDLPTAKALGRVTAGPLHAPHPLPSFPRTTVDGYAVRCADTFGASETLPAYLQVLGEVPMGAAAGLQLGVGQCALIHTGGMLPLGCDAVVMVEHTQAARQGEVEIFRAAAPGENILQIGEDVVFGEQVISGGVRLRPAEIGGLMALGITHVTVVARPRLAILSSGDEVVAPEEQPAPGQVRDVNAYTLSALAEAAGAQPQRFGIVPDQSDEMLSAARHALAQSDLLVITAGSSASARDLTAGVINALGSPGVLVHGVNVRPGKPTILAVCDGKPVIGLPGNPVSALVIAQRFVVPVIEKLLGLGAARMAAVPARLSLNLASQAGREDWVPVRIVDSPGGTLAEPVFGKSNLIFTLARADGLVCIPADATGLAAGELVSVVLM